MKLKFDTSRCFPTINDDFLHNSLENILYTVVKKLKTGYIHIRKTPAEGFKKVLYLGIDKTFCNPNHIFKYGNKRFTICSTECINYGLKKDFYFKITKL